MNTQQSPGYGDEDGREEVEVWECEPDCPVAMIDAQSGVTGGGRRRVTVRPREGFMVSGAVAALDNYGDFGGASRFFYTAKASRSEREAGLAEMPVEEGVFGGRGSLPKVEPHEITGRLFGGRGSLPKVEPHEITGRQPGSAGQDNPRAGIQTGARRNTHPTVKPVDLMDYLVRLITPPGGTVLDPFMGSGSTRIAAQREAKGFIGIDLEPQYVEIAARRLAQLGLGI
jgi:site-specific DNA-methyltransferase (adenine-specific)